jgi:CO/xanthine dehydrogenase Mo-binding subunit
VVVVPQPFGGEFTLYSSTQIPHILKLMLGLTTGIPETSIRVVAPSVGGAFGSKLNVYAEEILCLALARRLKRPVRWTEERSENSQATVQGRGMIQHIDLAADAEGRITAVRVRLLADMGAYLQLLTPGVPILGAFIYHGVYDVPAYSFSCTGVFTTKTPTDAYRGAGGATSYRPTSFPITPPVGWSTTAAITSPPLTTPWSWSGTRICELSSSDAATGATPSSWGSGSPRTWRCVAWPPAGFWPR